MCGKKESTHHSGQQRIFAIFPTSLLFSASALFAALLILVSAANASTQPAFLPAIYHLLLGSDAGWKNTSLSHPIPLTYNSYDEALRQSRIVQVDDGYWIAYAHYATTNVERRLFVAKTNLEGRTMIPPFQLGTVTRSDDPHSNYRFALIPAGRRGRPGAGDAMGWGQYQ